VRKETREKRKEREPGAREGEIEGY